MSDNGQITWTNEKRKLSELIPWPRNPRQIKVDQVKRLQESLDEFGQPETIAIGPGNEIYNGHQRLKSWADKHGDLEVDVRVSNRPLTEKEREKLTVFLHKGAAGEWNFDVLANEFDVDDLLDWGFDEHELDLDLWGVEPEPDPGAQIDRAEELREKWGVETGQLWRLGEHRLICGDCTDAEVVDRVMDGEKADTVSDPPYGIGYEYSDHDDKNNIENEQLVKDAWAIAPKGARIWTCGLMNLSRDLAWNLDAKVLCWHKGFAQAGNGLGGASTWEPVLVVGVKGGTLPNDYLDYSTDRLPGLRELHSCPKPVELFEHLISHLASVMIYDPFLGSGTTLIACERLGRKCRAVEISPAYCAVAIQRWVDMTGGEPELV